MAENGGLGQGMGKGIEVEVEYLGEGGIGGHLPDADRVEGGVEVGQGRIDVEILGAGRGFDGAAETGGAADEIGALRCLENGQKAAGGGTGDGAVVAVGDGAQGFVDVLDEFGEIERKLAGGVGGAGIDDDDGVGGDVGGQGGIAGRVFGFVAVEPVDDGVAGGARCGVGRRQVDPVGARGGHHLAAMGQFLNLGRGLGRRGHGSRQSGRGESAHLSTYHFRARSRNGGILGL